MDRRKFLLGAAPAVGLTTLVSAGCEQRSRAQDQPYAPTYFRPAEWEFLLAAVARLIPSEGAGPGAIEAGVPEFIDRQMELPYGHGAWFYLQGPFHPDSPAALGYQLRYTPREIYRWLDEHKLHFDESPAGQVFVCWESLKALSQAAQSSPGEPQ